MEGILEKIFTFNGVQDVSFIDEESDVLRRYELSSAFKMQCYESELIEILYKLFKDGGSLHDYPVESGFLHLDITPERQAMPFIDLAFNKDTIKHDTFFKNFVSVVGSLGLHITMGVIWTNTSKQKQRNTSPSWRDSVIENNVCACCGGDKHLEAHHIYGYAKYEMLREDPTNGIALCKWCHKKYHSYYPGDANPKDLIKFLRRFGGKDGGIQ